MYFTLAIVLSSGAAGESDGLYSLYTKDFGKIRARAQGVKKVDAKLRGHLETLALSRVGFVQTRHGERLVYAEALEGFGAIRSDIERMKTALYVAALLDEAIFPGEPDLPVWGLLERTLAEIEKSIPPFDPILSRFESEFLEHLGYGGADNISILGLPVPRPV